jgi:predicted ATPase
VIDRVQIDGYKTLDGVDARFAPLTIIFGANSAGKSNLFDALSLVSQIATQPSLEAAFERHRGLPLEAFTFGPGGLQGLMEQESARFAITVDVTLDDEVVKTVEAQIVRARRGIDDVDEEVPQSGFVRERHLRYSVTIEIFPSSGHLRVIDENLRALREDGEPSQSRRPFIETQNRRIHVRMEKQGHPRYEDLGQDRAVVSKSLYAPHHPHIAAFREEIARWRFYYLEPTLMREEVPIRDIESLDARGQQIAAFFNAVRVANPRQLRAFGKSLSAVIPMLEDLDVEPTPEGRVRLVATEGGKRMSARLLSEGTLRILGLLAITNPIEPVSVVGYEEPENGVHPRRLTLVADILRSAMRRGKTQLIVNSHSPLLPEYFIDDEKAAILFCYRGQDDRTVFEEFKPSGPLLAGSELATALADGTPFRERIARGDYGG